MAKMTSLHSSHKNKVFGPRNPDNDENDENGGVTQAKPWFPKSGDFTTPQNRLEVFWPKFLLNPLGSWTSTRSGHECPHLDASFSKVSRALPEVFWGRPRDIRPENFVLGLFFAFLRSIPPFFVFELVRSNYCNATLL